MKDYPISPKVIDWLRKTQSIRYLHLFDRSCNVLNQNDKLISLVLPSIGLGPFSLIVPEKVMDSLAREVEICVLHDDTGLEIGAWKLEIGRETAVWNPIPQWSKLKASSFSMEDVLPLPYLIRNRFDDFLNQLATQNGVQLIEATQKLAGLGEGLTPIGDDLLMGVLFALWVEWPHSSLIQLIGETAVPLTTTLSGEFLKSAVAGEATIHWHDLVNNKPNAKQKILSIGHTSGAAAWTGFVQTKLVIGNWANKP